MYKQTEKFTCGPSAYLEEFSIFKTKNEELKLHELGRIKPSRMFLGVSFLEINSKLKLYITDRDLPQGAIKLSFNPQIINFETQIKQYYATLMSKHQNNISIINNNPEENIKIIDELIKKNKKILLLSNSSFWMDNGTLHWITIKSKDKNDKYLCGDPRTGKIIQFSKDDIIKQMIMVQRENFNIQFVTN